jgi:NTE family protein
MTVRTLVLSGGGGRGAFHAGVYKYLCQSEKPGVDAAHQGPWKPDVVVGTSIGAVNGAAIVQGVTGDALVEYWLALREHHIEGIPPGMRRLSHWFSNLAYRRLLGVKLPRVAQEIATSPSAQESWPPLPLLPGGLSERLIGRWNNLLDTGPLRQTLTERWGISAEKLSASDIILLISATNVRTGELALFSNREIVSRKTGQRRIDVRTPINVARIIASCSIPLVYPWTQDEDGEVYWDGAVVANTPLSPALDAVRDRPLDEPMEAVVVLMTPWWEKGERPPTRREHLPRDFGEAITWTLDWALLASFRMNLKLTRAYNEEGARETNGPGQPGRYRTVNDVIIAPDDFLPVTRIIDYDETASRHLIAAGYRAAEQAFKEHFGA